MQDVFCASNVKKKKKKKGKKKIKTCVIFKGWSGYAKQTVSKI